MSATHSGWLSTLLLATVCVSTARARPIRVAALDSDATARTTVVVGTVVGVRAYPPAGTRASLQPQLLDIRVDAGLHLPRERPVSRPKRIAVTHSRRAPTAPPMINAFTPVELRYGRTYLLFLHRDGKQGPYSLVAPEDPYLIEVPAGHGWLLKTLPRKGPVLDRVLPLLERLVQRCYGGACFRPIWLLGNCRAFKTQARFRTRLAAFVKSLERIAGSSVRANTLTAAYTVLGQRKQRSVIKHIVRFVCHAPKRNRPTTPSDAIHWLQGFPELDQIRALKRILRCSRSAEVRRYARSRMGDLWRAHRLNRRL